jgi:translation initiation factor 5B
VPTKIAPMKVEEADDSSSDSEAEVERNDDFFDIEDVHDRIVARRKFHQKNKADYFRAPVVCVLGHVDTGKTKTLDNLRRTNVQDNEAGGITQQIGATNVPLDCIQQRTEMVKTVAFGGSHDIKIPGLLIIDTPGHESFANLRSRGSSLCDVAILVIDIMHGLENQTRESIKLLKKNNTPFVIALNKIDRLYQWQTHPEMDIKDCIQSQKRSTKDQFDDLYRNVINQMAIEELNIKLVYEFDGSENWKDEDDIWVPVCPTSAHSGDGMGNLMAQVIDLSQTVCRKKITFSYDLKCTIMEVKAIEGLGKAVDAILVNGRLKTNDIIVLGGQNGPICTHVKQIFTPPANKDLRVKNQWVKHATVKGATGVKIVGRDDLEKALAGLPLYVARRDDEVEYFKDLLEREIQVALKSIKLHSEGVYVQASTLGSLEALLEYLRTSKVKYSAINIGPINKRDIMKASTMLEHNEKFGVVLGFDVPITRDAQELADSFKPPIKIFTADIIYHLTDQFTKHLIDQKKRKQEELKHVAIFPASLSILPNCVFAKRDPIIIGVKVTEGQLKIGSPICVPAKENLCIGTLSSIEVNSSPVESAKKGEEVCIKIENTTGAPRLIGRHFEATDELVTKISREGIDALKEWFRDDMTKEDWNLCVKLKRTFQIL